MPTCTYYEASILCIHSRTNLVYYLNNAHMANEFNRQCMTFIDNHASLFNYDIISLESLGKFPDDDGIIL